MGEKLKERHNLKSMSMSKGKIIIKKKKKVFQWEWKGSVEYLVMEPNIKCFNSVQE